MQAFLASGAYTTVYLVNHFFGFEHRNLALSQARLVAPCWVSAFALVPFVRPAYLTCDDHLGGFRSWLFFFFLCNRVSPAGEDGLARHTRGQFLGLIDLNDISTCVLIFVLACSLAGVFFVWLSGLWQPYGPGAQAIKQNEPRAISAGL